MSGRVTVPTGYCTATSQRSLASVVTPTSGAPASIASTAAVGVSSALAEGLCVSWSFELVKISARISNWSSGCVSPFAILLRRV